MSAKVMKSNELLNETVNNMHHHNDVTLVEKLPIFINGNEKYASGLTKRTTVDDVKYAMLSVAEPNFQLDHLEDYAIFEKWQGNERILDGKIKIYKLIRLWKSLPGDQLSQVKFIIKKKKQTQPVQQIKLSARDTNVEKAKNNKFAFCTFSPALDKTWNYEKAKRKSSLVRKQLTANVQQENTIISSDSSDNEYTRDSSTDSSSSTNNFVKSNKYASIKRFNRSRKSTVRQTQQIKKSFIELVTKQNEIIDRQLENINQPIRSRSKSLTKFIRSKSLDKCDKAKYFAENLDENDIKQAFTSAKTDMNLVLDEKQSKEYSKLCKDYLKLQQSLNSKLQRIEDLKQELGQYDQFELEQTQTSKKLAKSIIKTNKKLQSSIDTNNLQSTKLNDLSSALNRIDDIISLKEKFIQSLEKELQRLDSTSKLNDQVDSYQEERKKSLAFTSESASSSTSSVLTSVSQQQPNLNYTKQSNKMKYNSSYTGLPGDNESDTGISSANSEDYNTHLETLV